MLSNLKIGIRLGIGFAIALLLLLVVTIIGIARVGELQTDINDLVKDKNVKTKTGQRHHRQRQFGRPLSPQHADHQERGSDEPGNGPDR
jgi:phosphoglycerate-specific signal transduction histidine kinase